jgi:glucose-6-phosphate isomerase
MSLRVSLADHLRDSTDPLVESACSTGFAGSLRAGDHTLWGPAAEAEASIRLGWVRSPGEWSALAQEILNLREELAQAGVSSIALCGMGGSSLAPEVMAKCHGVALQIVDSTHPDVVHQALSGDLSHTAVVVSSKSGGTVETDSQMRAFVKAFEDQGIDPAPRVIVVTDPGSALEDVAKEAGYRVFLGNPSIGGRFSVFSPFGLVPSGLAGVDIATIVSDAEALWDTLGTDTPDNPALLLGAGMAVGHPQVNKVLLRPFAGLPGLGDWIEQLVAESTGKEGLGILPVVDSLLVQSERTADCLSIGEPGMDADIEISGTLGEHFLVWQYATAYAGAILGVNPFDQPNVESAKIAARALLGDTNDNQHSGTITLEGGSVWAGVPLPTELDTIARAASFALSLVSPRSYLALCVFGDSTSPEDWVLVRDHLEATLNRPVTLGFGPRFLHSTGQLHKGGPAEGVFLQIVEPAKNHVEIPGRDFDFLTLLSAQARGDRIVLHEHGQATVALELADTDSRRAVLDALGS